MTQQIVVALIVALAAVYAVWRWMPGSWRRLPPRGLPRARSARDWSTRSVRGSLRRRWARLRVAASCDSCGSCSTGASSKTGADGNRPLTRAH